MNLKSVYPNPSGKRNIFFLERAGDLRVVYINLEKERIVCLLKYKNTKQMKGNRVSTSDGEGFGINTWVFPTGKRHSAHLAKHLLLIWVFEF
jgi:hypothetical protein